MFERYTERARRVIFFARYEASQLGGAAIDTEHLLLGVLREGKGAVAEILARSGLDHATVSRPLEARARQNPPTSTSVDIPLTTAVKHVLQHAGSEARGMGVDYIGTEHFLLGLLRVPECEAARILGEKGLTLAALREEVRARCVVRAAETPPDAFVRLADLLRRLEDRRAVYRVSPFLSDGVRVEVALPDERWLVSFFPNARVAVEVFAATGSVEDESSLARLLDRLRPPKKADG
jgi:ATP-dependent Clp protease ATP-binding subunit ClpC